MAKLTYTVLISLDGVMQAPGGPQEDTTNGFDLGGWVVPFVDQDMVKKMGEIYGRAQAFILGRGTYDIFSNYWPDITDPADPIAGPLNKLPKYIASHTLHQVTWKGSHLMRDAVQDVTRLKQQYTGEIQLHGSPLLAQSMMQHDLIDEFNFCIFPVVLGKGKNLFGSGTLPRSMKCLNSWQASTGVLMNTYARTGEVKTGTMGH